MGLDFANTADQLAYWLSHITQGWKGPALGSGENGIDIGLPYHTPIYALQSGPVVGAGFYGGGGVVSIQTQPGTSFYYQHLSDLNVQAGQTVKAGQLIGWSGGQLGYGSHPSDPQYSSGPHIEVGINPPYGATSIWHSEGANVNPMGYLQALQSGTPAAAIQGVNSLTGVPIVGGVFDAGQQAGASLKSIASSLSQITTFFQQINTWVQGVVTWATAPQRLAKLFFGGALILIGVVVLILASKPAQAAIKSGWHAAKGAARNAATAAAVA